MSLPSDSDPAEDDNANCAFIDLNSQSCQTPSASDSSDDSSIHRTLPLLVLKDIVSFPKISMPIWISRPSGFSLARAIQSETQPHIIVTAQREESQAEETGLEDIHLVGVIASVSQIAFSDQEQIKISFRGIQRVLITQFIRGDQKTCDQVCYQEIPEITDEISQKDIDTMYKIFQKNVASYAKHDRDFFESLLPMVQKIDELSHAMDVFAAVSDFSVYIKQDILNTFPLRTRFKKIMRYIKQKKEIAKLDKKIEDELKIRIDHAQKIYILKERTSLLQKEIERLGGGKSSSIDSEAHIWSEQLMRLPVEEEIKQKIQIEINKFESMPNFSSESVVARNYLDAFFGLPWGVLSPINEDLKSAKKILDTDHYGMTEVKERILEYLAVLYRTKQKPGQIICFTGPPGVGKTSIVSSIAKATHQPFVRFALGGVRDEAEIRGHRRTYVAAMMGKILQKITKAKCMNPVFLLDEIDKIGFDHMRGDVASALLEVLDREQNQKFSDHYLEMDFDLSKVFFIATANDVSALPAPLLDRLEVIKVTGYTEQEKVEIAARHLIPKQMAAHGMTREELVFHRKQIRTVIRHYTMESGVRHLERSIEKICRKSLYQLESKTHTWHAPHVITHPDQFLGPRKYFHHVEHRKGMVGQVSGLAWTEYGGDILAIEAISTKGKGRMHCTGSLGDVLQESIQAAMTVVRHHAPQLHIENKSFDRTDIHIHLPEGAVPKDGPSAGIAIATALVSVFKDLTVPSCWAMTGEITLQGKVLAIGGLKEKLMAAQRHRIKKIIIPKVNHGDLADIPEDVLSAFEIVQVSWIKEVWLHIFGKDALFQSKPKENTQNIKKTAQDTAEKKIAEEA